MKAPTPRWFHIRWIVLILLAGIALPSAAQNTKGDRPAVNNERKIRETKGKTVKRRDKAKTRDIAGRRLRTKDKTSANRANVGIRQPDPYAGRPRVSGDRPAKPRDRIYSEKPTEKPRVNRGDIAGHRIRTSKPRRTEAARANIHPQSGPYVRFGSGGLQGDRPYKHKETASGRPIIHRVPAAKERAWKGDIKGRAVSAPRSVSSQRKNTFPQANQYSQYVEKKFHKDRAVSNAREISRSKRMSHTPKTSGPGGGYISAGNKGFVKRGRKNVYWGKFTKSEKPVTTDITGGPIRKRNYRSPSPGLVGRDTLKHFTHRPQGDVKAGQKGRETPGVRTSPSGRSWIGDISGHRLRRGRPSGDRANSQRFSGYISISGSGGAGKLRSAPYSQSRKGDTAGKPIPGKGVGMGAKAVADGLRRTKGGSSKRFTAQGEGFSGYIKADRRKVGADVGSYSGNIRGQTKAFGDQGTAFTGFIKSRRPSKGGGSVSGKLWNNNETAIAQRGLPSGAGRIGNFSGNLKASQKAYGDQGEEFTGYIKATKPLKGGGSVSGQSRNNADRPVAQRRLPIGADEPGLFSGNLKAGQKAYADQGEEFTGYIKARRPEKGGGSVSGQSRNNKDAPIARKTLPRDSDKPGLFSGNLKASQKVYEDQGEEFTGYIKARKPEKGGGSVTRELGNNDGKSITALPRSTNSINASRFEGRSKAKGGKPSTSGFDSEGKEVRLKEQFTQSPRAVDESTKKHKPERAGFQAEGIQVKVAKKDYDKREHTVRGALPGDGPERNSVRANVFSSGSRAADRRRNPHSVDEALKGTYYGGRTNAQMGAFNGNVKVKKFNANRHLHPDSKFAHGHDNNVDEERTFFTNVKLWWTKLFHDTESQPTNVKEKVRRPRYDKREQGMWAE
jgi:hypothetical protein